MGILRCAVAAVILLLLPCAPVWGQEDAPSSVVEEAPPSADAVPPSAEEEASSEEKGPASGEEAPSTAEDASETGENAPVSPEDASPSAEDVPSSSAATGESARVSIGTARALIKIGRFNEALIILRALTERGETETDVLFLIGLAATGAAQKPGVTEDDRETLLNAAIAAYRSILVHEPGLVRVRLELGLAFFLKEEDDLARRHFERVLAGQPPALVVANVTKFLRVMRARRRWNGYFGFSLAPDTNINAASDAQFIYIRGLPFRRAAQVVASSDIGVVGWGGAEYQYPLAERWRLRAGFDVNHREYKGGQFDQTFVQGHVGPRWFLSQTTEMSLLASASQRWWGGSPFNYDFGARLEVEHRFSRGLRASGRATWQDRKYQQNPGLAGPVMVFSLGTSYVLFPTVQVNGLVGFLQQDSRWDRWDSQGYWFRVGTNVALPWGFTVGLSSEFRWTDYKSGWFPFIADNTARRADRTRILQATLLNRALTVYGFSPQVSFSNQLRESNAQAFDYQRNLVELRWVRQF